MGHSEEFHFEQAQPVVSIRMPSFPKDTRLRGATGSDPKIIAVASGILLALVLLYAVV
jgi:hypothetical protein